MKFLKEFFNKENVLKCLVFSMIVSLLFTWRLTYVKHIPFFSGQTMQVYMVFTLANFLVLFIVFFILFWLGQRDQQE